MVAVRTGFPSPMQPMGGFPSMALPAGQTPVPAPVPPMPLAGFPPPPVKSPMAQQGSNAPRRRRFGDSLEGMLGRNIFATQQQRPMPTPMMPRPMEMGGAVQYFANGGNANRQAAESMLAAGIGNVGGKAITSEAQDIQDRFSGLANRRKRRRRKRRERLAREEAARLAAEQAALAASSAAVPEAFTPPSGGIGAAPPGFGAAALPTGGPGTFPPAAPPPTDITPEVFVPEVDAASTAEGFMNIEKPDRSIDREIAGGTFDDDPAFTQGVIPSEVSPGPQFTYQNIGGIGLGDNREDIQANLGSDIDVDPSLGIYSAMDSFDNLLGDRNAGMGFRYTNQAERDLRDLGQMDTTPPIFPPSDRVFTPSGTQIAPEAATTTGFSYFPSDTRDVMPPVIGEKDDSFAESMFIDEINPYAVGGGFDVTAPRETDEGTRFAYPEDKPLVPPANTGGSDRDDKSRPRLTSEELESLKASLGEQVPISGIEKVINQVIGKAFFGLGSGFADKLKASSEAERQAIVDQHLNALNSGATPVYNDKGEYVGFNMNTMDTFADKVLAADDIMAFMPPSFGTFENPAYQADADGDGVPDFERFQQIMDAQSEAAKNDPFGQSTEQGFITSDGKEFFVDAGGNVVEVKDGVVPFEVGGGDDVTDIFTETITTGGGDSGGGSDTTGDVDLGHTVDENGNIVCNTEGYIYNPETKICELPKEEEVDTTPGSGIGTGTSGESFDDVLKRVVVAAPPVAPISANVRPMQEGGMAGLNRAADNFLKALAG